MTILTTTKLDILRKLIDLSDIRLYTLSSDVIWGKSALVPNLSIVCEHQWIILKTECSCVCDGGFEINYIDVYESNSPLDAEYVFVNGGHKILNRSLSEIRFVHPNKIKSVEVYKFAESHLKKDCIAEYDGVIVFNFFDRKIFSVSTIQVPTGLLGICTERADVNKLISESKDRVVITR